LTEPCVLRADEDIRHHSDLKSTAESHTIDGCDERFAERREDAPPIALEVIIGEHLLAVHVCNLLDVGASGEGGTLAGENNDADLIVPLELEENLAKLLHEGAR